ncbi:RNA polymerase sigma factor [Amycolatopsis thailandensis]|uniref:RNA polymerase sigma factor n=1 Tax=Amycolatopsis thailandensis TaxID=589330 RepID=UPI003630BCAC
MAELARAGRVVTSSPCRGCSNFLVGEKAKELELPVAGNLVTCCGGLEGQLRDGCRTCVSHLDSSDDEKVRSPKRNPVNVTARRRLSCVAKHPVAVRRGEAYSKTGQSAVALARGDGRTADLRLTQEVRDGNLRAYGPLYERHVASARKLVRQLARSEIEADDLVSEAFSKVLDVLRAGRGPGSKFRAYLLTVLRHVAYDKSSQERQLKVVEDISTAVAPALVSVPFSDSILDSLERVCAAKAFARLRRTRWEISAEQGARVSASGESPCATAVSAGTAGRDQQVQR